ncbi:hypothetical protein MNEG_3427 [Monoraphidium neglectum]|uniref:TAFII55 protein conserved region domain-containing protein n=1 Tax=Monoraphidium neglectum TaxID=145388 RepID=A0A0D2K1S6_9CHLO|nr:hypothetical protein MNEG_3427 [Monoraphidium neglectum]KIZ04533.1 hypothetical protein MNEG_3427 [Monoraphidium neglectum]|eukprot:XP_013903552.1 hypothetical protein MNEG_3427 [Monoraphidium neglectum]
MAEVNEEHFIFRVKPPQLAAKLRGWLREQQGLKGRAELLFEDNNRRGKLVVEGVAYPVSLEDLPTRVESFKTLDDTNLVKMTDVGQVGPKASVQGWEDGPGVRAARLEALSGQRGYAGAGEAARGGATAPCVRSGRASPRAVAAGPPLRLPPSTLLPPIRDLEKQQAPAAVEATEARDGVTPPMRRARARQFRPRFTIQRDSVFKAPEGWTFRDVEEEYRVDSITGEGRWVAVAGLRGRFGRKPAGFADAAAGAAGPGGAAAGKPGRKKKKRGSEDDADFEDELTDDDE